ncbi:MAG: elongation factor G [Candidatus Kapabacteria bacterium]|nr:elongation factor G [Candidatus Kapabacteria bacterium]
MNDISKIRNIGIAAHIDSGKTTLSERILYYTGKIHQMIEVRDKSGAGPTMDSMDLEREKGITIQSAATYCQWKDYHINLIDTPGHIDFTVEVERSLRVLDGAVLVLCSVAGVQSQTMTVERQMRRYNVPRIAFINKVDRSGANPDRVVTQLQVKLNLKPVLLTMPIGLEEQFEGVVDLLKMKAVYFDGPNGENIREEEIPEGLKEEAEYRRLQIVESLADFDDGIAEKFLGDEYVSTEEIIPVLRKATIGLHTTPVYIGTAKRNKGVQLMLDGVGMFLPNPSEKNNEALDLDNNEAKVLLEAVPNKPFIGLAFKLEDGRFGQLTYMRIYQGSVKKGDFITNVKTKKRIKVPRLVRMHAKEMHDIDEAVAGDIIAMFGVECSSGDTFTDGTVNYSMTSMFVPKPVIELSVAPKEKTAQVNFSKALNRFQKEDPTFQVYLDEESNETIIKGMGELHLEIYIERIKREYNCDVIVGKPKVAYRETITQRAEFNYTHKKQTGGSGQFARVAGYIEPIPAEENKDYEFVDAIVGGVISREFIPGCDKGFQDQVASGVLIEQPVVNVRVVLNDGQTHPVDSSEMAFRLASRYAMKEALAAAKPIILEPIMKLETSAPDEFQGVIIGQINQRRGIIVNTTVETGYAIVTAEVPLSEMFGYSSDLRGATQGKGEFTMEFLKYAPVPKNVQEQLIEEYKKLKANK